MCIHAFRQPLEYYKQNSSPDMLPGTKAFDRVNHCLLFKKLLDRNMTLHIGRLLVCWYRTPRFNVQWGGCSSKCFSAANGVPHGGILSPWLFNIYIDVLSISLSNANAGCKFGGMYVNRFSYADDMAILSPSASGLQKLLNIGASYVIKHDIIYNVKKTQCMVVPSTKFKLENTPSVFFKRAKLQYVDSYKYLGMFIHVRNDDLDIVRQLKFVIQIS